LLFNNPLDSVKPWSTMCE